MHSTFFLRDMTCYTGYFHSSRHYILHILHSCYSKEQMEPWEDGCGTVAQRQIRQHPRIVSLVLVLLHIQLQLGEDMLQLYDLCQK